MLKLQEAQHRELGISLPNLRKVYTTRNWLIDRLYQVVRGSCNGEKIAAEDVYYILMHFAGQLDYAKVFFLFTLFNSDKESDSIRDKNLTFIYSIVDFVVKNIDYHEKPHTGMGERVVPRLRESCLLTPSVHVAQVHAT